MPASLTLLQVFVKQMRRGVLDAMLALPKTAQVCSAISDEQRALDAWLFNRDSR